MRTLLLLPALLVLLPTAAFGEEAGRKRVQGTDVSLVPPREFRVSRSFSGFERPDDGATIMVTVLPAGISQFIVGMTDEAMKKKGMTVLSRQRIEVDRLQGLLMGISQSAQGTEFRKWMLVFGDSTKSALIVATFPKARESQLSASMKDAVLSAKFGARGADFGEEEGPAPEEGAAKKLEGVPFRITPAPPLQLAEVMNKTVLLTRTGTYPIEEPGDPIFLAGGAIGAVTPTDREAYARKRLLATKTVKEIEVGAVKEVTIDGLPGIEIVATAKHDPTGRILLLYQVMLFTEDSYFLMQGMGLKNADPGFLAPFRKTAQSFKR